MTVAILLDVSVLPLISTADWNEAGAKKTGEGDRRRRPWQGLAQLCFAGLLFDPFQVVVAKVKGFRAVRHGDGDEDARISRGDKTELVVNLDGVGAELLHRGIGNPGELALGHGEIGFVVDSGNGESTLDFTYDAEKMRHSAGRGVVNDRSRGDGIFGDGEFSGKVFHLQHGQSFIT